MWRKIVDWYREWEQEQLGVLEQPALAGAAPAGYRRYCAYKLAGLSAMEREQLRAFSLRYSGARMFAALAKLLLLSTLAGAALHLAFPARYGWVGAIVAANMLGIAFAWGTTVAWFNYRSIANRKLTVFAWFVLCAMGGALLFAAWSAWSGDRAPEIVLEKLPRMLAIVGLGAAVVFAVPFLVIGVLRQRHYEALTARLQRDAERERMARELSEAQLRLLRAQIEPHFLFNTLGAVQQLAQQGAPRAAELTASLIAFLRASLSEMRSEQVSLGAEFGLVEAYLQVMKARLGERLHYTLELPEALAQVAVPGMIVLTLAENAIKHGIEPSLRGGAVSVSARSEDGKVAIRVLDTGVGMSAAPGAGVGLAGVGLAGVGLENVRDRLRLVHGAGATLELHEAAEGVVAEIAFPHQDKSGKQPA